MPNCGETLGTLQFAFGRCFLHALTAQVDGVRLAVRDGRADDFTHGANRLRRVGPVVLLGDLDAGAQRAVYGI